MSNKTTKNTYKELSSNVLASKSWKEKCVIKKAKKKLETRVEQKTIPNWNNVKKKKKAAVR